MTMKFSLAPMEGVSTFVFRQAFHRHMDSVDHYYTPFLVPHLKKGFAHKEIMEISPENAEGMNLTPQILSNNAEGFMGTAKKLKAFGYTEINLNLGCPSKTVVSKNRGSGLLNQPEEVERLLDGIFEGCSQENLDVSIKTRIGRFDPDEFYEILQIYNRYPVKKLIIHPRVQTDFYKNMPNLDMFEVAVEESKIPLCYNGDIVNLESFWKVQNRFPQIHDFMIGRGLVANPFLVDWIRESLEEKDTGEITLKNSSGAGPTEINEAGENRFSQVGERNFTLEERQKIFAYLKEMMDIYMDVYHNERGTTFKIKEIWEYMKMWFPEDKKSIKKIKKAGTLKNCMELTGEILLR